MDFDDSEYGFKEEDKSSFKAKNENILRSFVGKCDNGVFATMAEAIEGLAIPIIKRVGLVKKYDGPLTLGDPKAFDSAISINVERWPVTKVKAPDPASTVVLKSDPTGTQSTMTLDNDDETQNDSAFNSVKQHRNYKINDPTAPGGKRDVEFEDLAKGYSYGSTAVQIAEAEWHITKLDTTKDFSIIGFISNKSFEPFVGLGEVCVTVAKSFDEKSQVALSALIHALYELEQFAVARFVTKEGKDPEILLLKPSVDIDMECLYDVPLPFAEDARLYRFPPLDKVITITGKTLTEHRLLPDDKLKHAMSDLVDSMDISEFDQDHEGYVIREDEDVSFELLTKTSSNPAEYASLDDLYAPIIHRLNQAVRARAVHEDGPIEDIPSVLLKYSRPPDGLVKKSKRKIDRLIEAADVKKGQLPTSQLLSFMADTHNDFPIAPEKKKFKRQQESGKNDGPISGLDISRILTVGAAQKQNNISKNNAVPEFKQVLQTLAQANEDEGIVKAVKEMGNIVYSLIKESTGDSNYEQAIESIGVMREQMIGLESPDLYNDFLKELKTKIKSNALGGDRKEMWLKIRYPGRLGLITSAQSEASGVTTEEARSVSFVT